MGLAGSPSLIDTRTLALKDITAVGVLSASPGVDATIQAYATRAVDPRPLVAATVGLQQVGAVLAGERPEGPGPGPKMVHPLDHMVLECIEHEVIGPLLDPMEGVSG